MGFSFLVCMYMGKITIMFSSLIYKDSWDWVCKEEKNENDRLRICRTGVLKSTITN